MGSLFASLAALSALLPVVAARRGGGGGISISVDVSSLQTANVAALSIFAFVTLIQLLKTLPRLFRSGIPIPAAGVVAALVIMVVGYALGAGRAVVMDRVDSFREQIDSDENFDLDIAAGIFLDWGDPALFVAVAFVLHNRYRAVQKKASAATIGFTSTASVLVVLMIALVAAKQGIVAATFDAELHDAISFTEATDRITTSNNCFYAFVAFHVVSTIFLAVSAFLVKARTKNDKIMSLTLFAIVPLLLMHALARLILVIVEARLLDPESDSFNPEAEDAIDFTDTFIRGLLNVAAMSFLVSLLAQPSLWSAERFLVQDATSSQPHTIVQDDVPPAQFPGQWRSTQQPQQGPYPQQYVYVPVLLPQNPAMLGTQVQLPHSEKVQTSPQTSSQTSSQPSPQPSPAPLHTTDHEPV